MGGCDAFYVIRRGCWTCGFCPSVSPFHVTPIILIIAVTIQPINQPTNQPSNQSTNQPTTTFQVEIRKGEEWDTQNQQLRADMSILRNENSQLELQLSQLEKGFEPTSASGTAIAGAAGDDGTSRSCGTRLFLSTGQLPGWCHDSPSTSQHTRSTRRHWGRGWQWRWRRSVGRRP